MTSISVQHTIDKMEAALADLVPGSIRHKAYARAINKTLAQAKTKWVKIAAKGGQLPISYVRKSVTTKIANPTNLSGSFQVAGKYQHLKAYGDLTGGTKQNATGTIAGKWGMHKSAFIAKMKSGHMGVYSRKAHKGRAIRQLHGPAVPRPLQNKGKTDVSPEADSAARAVVSEKLEPIMLKQLDYEIKSVKAKYGL